MSLSANSIRIMEAKFGKDVAHEVIALLNQSAGSAGTTYTQTYSTADRTHANLTSATLTDSTGGTPGSTLAAATNTTSLTLADGAGTNDGTIGAVTDAATSLAAIQELAAQLAIQRSLNTVLINAVSSLAAQVNALRVDLIDAKQLANAIVDDLQAAGVVG